MKTQELPFKTTIERGYNAENILEFTRDWKSQRASRKNRLIKLDNPLHLQLGKFKTYGVSVSELIDVGMRYALSQVEFKEMMARLIHIKNIEKKN